MSLSQDPAFSYLKDRYVVGFRDITGQRYAGISGKHDVDSGSSDTMNGSGSHNVQLFVMTPDKTVLHCLPGYWNSSDLVRELKLAEQLAQLLAAPGDFSGKYDQFHRLQLAHAEEHPAYMSRRSEIQGFDRGIEMSKAQAGSSSDRNPSTVDDYAEGGPKLKTVDVIMHERMALRPFQQFEEFDVASYVDIGGTYYDKESEHASALSRMGPPRTGDGEDDAAGSGSTRGVTRASAASGDVRMARRRGGAAAGSGPVAGLRPAPPAFSPATVEQPQFKVMALAGGSTAVLQFHGQNYPVQAGDNVPDDLQPVFKVRSVDQETVTVVLSQSQRPVTRKLEP